MMFQLAQADAWYHEPYVVYPVLALAGLIAGTVNTIAGGGSFLTLPVFMYVGGLDPQLANGTNRVAVLPATISSSRVFYKHGLIDGSILKRLLIPLLMGLPIGALAAILLPKELFRGVFGALFLAMAVFFCLKPKAMLNTDRQPVGPRWMEWAYFFGLGMYVGFIQAGYGLLMLVGLSLFHARELVGANAVKNLIGAVLTVLAVVFFAVAGQVSWLPGLTMGVGNLVGGIIGAKLAIRKGQRLIFAFLIVVMVATGVKMVVEAVW